jgi:hypothetical protein
MKQISADLSYVDQMLEEREKRFALGRINPHDFSDLYLLVRNYRMVYWQYDKDREQILLQLVREIEYLYSLLYPDEPRIQDNRNSRYAGRPKKYDEAFENEVMRLLQDGYGPAQIAAQTGCSKSFVSKLKRKHMIQRG